MQAVRIQDTRAFMAHLFNRDTFGSFEVLDVTITTFAVFHIDGSYHADFYDDPSIEIKEGSPVPWKMLQPAARSLILGRHTPLSMKLVFRLAGYNVEKLLRQSGISLSAEEIAGLFLNISYDRSGVTCTTGTSLKIFTLDKTLDHTWDEMVLRLFKSRQIPFTIE